METTKQKALLKHFSSILRKRALNEGSIEDIDPIILRFLSRKELIEIIKVKFENTIPKEFNLMELENVELLEIIGDDMYIISYITSNWVRVAQTERIITSVQKPKAPITKKLKPNDKKDKTTT